MATSVGLSIPSANLAPATQAAQSDISNTNLSAVNLSQLLSTAATSAGKITCYTTGNQIISVSYRDLLFEAREKSKLLLSIEDITPSSILLLHFDTQYENIIWFWAATLAGIVPAISTPLVNDLSQRKKHLVHVKNLLENPMILTRQNLLSQFNDVDGLNIRSVEALQPGDTARAPFTHAQQNHGSDLAALMLTSGSTGNAKAVCLRHDQILSALSGKIVHHGTQPGDVFLNWVGLDHVASMTEVHLHAMLLGSDQIHIPAPLFMDDPINFVRMLEKHKVAYTFAPNFFLNQVRDALHVAGSAFTADLTRLRALISGGEANPVSTCDTLSRLLSNLGAKEVIRPGFGMTETCAGSIYSRSCPSWDLEHKLEFANLGTCIPGMRMRIIKTGTQANLAEPGQIGELQVSGTMVFNQYYNDTAATQAAFTTDGWFITGDLAYIDIAGNLNLAGRSKDTIIINGVKWTSTEIEMRLDDEAIPGIVPSFVVVFPSRAQDAPTEDVSVVYSPSGNHEESQVCADTLQAISKTVSLVTGKKPAHVIPVPQKLLEKSSLGKISRAKVRAAFEKGEYESYETEFLAKVKSYQQDNWQTAKSPNEKIVAGVTAGLVNIQQSEVSINDSIFDLGITSFNLILLQSRVQKALGKDVELPMSTLLLDPTIVGISAAIDTLLSKPRVYTPIVPLQTSGNKTPLFLIHPGSGDILVFIALAAYFPTRPIYALRTRGYNTSDGFFSSIQETAETYAEHIRQVQPKGPYAIAGYSLGSTLAYEVSKTLEALGQEVKFVASIDYPPHIRHYVQHLDWIDVLLHIAFFLELIDEPTMVRITPELHTLDRTSALQYILDIGDHKTAEALAIDSEKLALISDIAENFRVCVQTYEPVGKVRNLDVFVADPPTYAAKDRHDWRYKKLGRWADFSETDTRFHDCPGIHAKMLNPQHVGEFARLLKNALRNRGL